MSSESELTLSGQLHLALQAMARRFQAVCDVADLTDRQVEFLRVIDLADGATQARLS